MKSNETLRSEIFQIIKNQLDNNEPPETKTSYKRLIGLGYIDFQVKQFIGQCIAVELFDVLKYQRPFNETRYIKNLKQLPEEPSED